MRQVKTNKKPVHVEHNHLWLIALLIILLVSLAIKVWG